MKHLIAMFLLFPLSALADSYSGSYNACLEQAEGVTVNILDCISRETEYQDARLNNAYRNVMKSLSPTEKQALRGKQRAWIKARDNKVRAVIGGGQQYLIESQNVFLEETMKRAEELESF